MKAYCWSAYFFIMLLPIAALDAQTYPAGFVQVDFATNITNPTAMAFAPDGRLFVAQQQGALRVIKDGVLIATPFVSLTVSSTGERGLIGIAFDPDFADNHWIYLYYTVPGSPAHNRISRLTANGDVALPGSELIILELDPLSTATNHNGGAMHFGKDGKLYVAIGENAKSANAQNLDTYHGKLLRLNKDGSVPDGNPFVTGSEQRRRVWAYGLRNPFTFSIHPVSGRILVNDVGQSSREEVNDATTGGKNFGWPATEGNFNPATFPNYTLPIYQYTHATGNGTGCAITGGTFYSPATTNYPSPYFDTYVIQDLCGAWINTLDLSSGAVRSSFATGIPGNALALTTGPDGNLYFLSRDRKAVLKIVYSLDTTPYILTNPQAATVAEGHALSLSVTAAGSTPLAFQWFRNGIAIGGAVSSTYSVTSTTPADAGAYTVRISNTIGNVTSTSVEVQVISNKPPVANILTPDAGTFYRAGDVIHFSGEASDAEDGTLSSAALQWNINFHHDTHKHDEPPIVGTSVGSFTVPTEGETSANVWYRIILTATDANGFIGQDSVDVHPLTSTLTLTTDPEGLQLTLDGENISTPFTVTSVQGLQRALGAPSPQAAPLVSFTFDSWSDGNTEGTRTLATPDHDETYVAHFLSIVSIADRLSDLSAFPNPSREEAIWLRGLWKPPVTVRMVDVLAREVARATWTDTSGLVDQRFVYGKLSPAIYSIIIEQKDSRRVIRVHVLD